MVASKSFASLRLRPIQAKEPLDDPAPLVNSEANLTGVLAHDLDRDQRCLGDLLASIPAVGEDPLGEREDAARSPQTPSRSWTLAGWGSMTRPRPSVFKDHRGRRPARLRCGQEG
jgi:hypothetical protein